MAIMKFDYDSVLARLKARVLSKLDGENLLLFSTNSAFLEAAAEEFADADMYDEFLTREAVWETAQGYNSIMKQVSFYDYKPHRKVGSTGYIRVSTSKTFKGSWGTNIAIPKFTQMSGGGLTFLSKESTYLAANADYVDIPVIQGEKTEKTIEITSTAYPELRYASIAIKDPNIENSLYSVKVNGILWTEVDSIRLATSNADLYYTLQTLSDFSGVEITFGNGVFGKKLEYGDIVTFEYLQTKGEDGNVLSGGIITSVDTTLKDESGTDVELFCTNLDALVGGSDYESIESIRSTAPLSFQTGNRAISSSDYATLIKQTNLVDKVQVWGEKEINEDAGNKPGTYVEASENLIYITGITIDPETGIGLPLSESSKSLIREALNDKKGTTDILQFVDTQVVYVTFESEVYISNTKYSSEQVIRNVHNALASEYSLSEAAYKKNLYFSDYYKTIDAAEGVDHHRTTLSFSEFFKFSSAYLVSMNINLANIMPGTVKLYIRDTAADGEWSQLGHDNGSGILVGDQIDPDDPSQGSYDLNSATISYTDGAIGDIIITYGLNQPFSNYEIRVDFALQDSEEGDLNLKYRQQLFAYYKDKIITHIMGVA